MTGPGARIGAAPRPWLLADIGGTNARFGWLDRGSDDIRHIQTLAVADHDSVATAAADYLRRVATALGPASVAPQAAAFAVATAVHGDAVAFTNSPWSFSREAVRAALQLQTLQVLNDFEALALSLPRLRADQWQAIGTAGAPRDGVRAVIGPGTGLGVASLVPTPQGWVAVPGEGGHATLAPADDFDSAVLAAARTEHAHISAERLLSGIGLPLLHRAVARARGRPVQTLPTEAIVERGLAGDDDARHTLDTFCALLGSYAGNVALLVGARGGVYIGGGIVPRLGALFFASRFLQRFEAKGRFQAYLQGIPTVLITDTLAALSGAAVALDAPG